MFNKEQVFKIAVVSTYDFCLAIRYFSRFDSNFSNLILIPYRKCIFFFQQQTTREKTKAYKQIQISPNKLDMVQTHSNHFWKW